MRKCDSAISSSEAHRPNSRNDSSNADRSAPEKATREIVESKPIDPPAYLSPDTGAKASYGMVGDVQRSRWLDKNAPISPAVASKEPLALTNSPTSITRKLKWSHLTSSNEVSEMGLPWLSVRRSLRNQSACQIISSAA